MLHLDHPYQKSITIVASADNLDIVFSVYNSKSTVTIIL